jgi:hypothetical protein
MSTCRAVRLREPLRGDISNGSLEIAPIPLVNPPLPCVHSTPILRPMGRSIRKAFAGIDVAFAKGKRLPVSVTKPLGARGRPAGGDRTRQRAY